LGHLTRLGRRYSGQVPDHTTALVLPIAKDDDILNALIDKVHDCFKAGESATGARLEFKYDWDNRFRAVYSNRVMSELFDANIKKVRPTWDPVSPSFLIETGATDMGSVSQCLPSIHPWIAIGPPDMGMHSIDSAAAAASDEGHKAMLDGAKAMAMTALDLMMQPDILKKAWSEFESTFK
jgi:metal-dependent amidase/aminoacylase/carboxypeptidase family protein